MTKVAEDSPIAVLLALLGTSLSTFLCPAEIHRSKGNAFRKFRPSLSRPRFIVSSFSPVHPRGTSADRSLKPSTIPSASSSALCGNFLYPDDAKSGSRLMNDRLRDSFRKLSLDEIASSDQLSVNGATSPAARINRIDGTQKLAKQLSLGGSSTFQK